MLGLGVSSVAEAKGHKPEEQALNAILNTAGHDPNLFQSLIDYRNPKAQAAKSPYGALLTPALINRIHTKEKQTVDKTCGGHYSSQNVCGLDFNPITCSQEDLGRLSFKTRAKQSDVRIIRVYSKTLKTSVGHYRMVWSQNRWKLDAINCGHGVTFNFKNYSLLKR